MRQNRNDECKKCEKLACVVILSRCLFAASLWTLRFQYRSATAKAVNPDSLSRAIKPTHLWCQKYVHNCLSVRDEQKKIKMKIFIIDYIEDQTGHARGYCAPESRSIGGRCDCLSFVAVGISCRLVNGTKCVCDALISVHTAQCSENGGPCCAHYNSDPFSNYMQNQC